jgi:glycerophosphoryl diester phosphodiesterase
MSIGLPLEAPLVATIRAHHLDKASAPIVVESFELNNLVELRETYRLTAKEVFLTSTSGKGFGDSESYADLLTPAGLAKISRWVNLIGPRSPLAGDGQPPRPTGA